MGGTLCAWSVLGRAVACSRAPAGCVRCVVAGPHCLAPATAAPRTRHHAHRHGPSVSRHAHEHSVWACGHGLWLWGVGCGPRRPAPPRTAATPHLPTPVVPAAACGRGRSHPLGSITPEIACRTPGIPFSRQRLALALSGGGDNQGVCDVTEACGLGRGGPEGVWVAAAATPRPGRPRPPPPAPRPSPPDAHLEVVGGMLTCRRARSGRQQHRDGRCQYMSGWCSAGHATTPQGPPPPRAQCQQGQTRQANPGSTRCAPAVHARRGRSPALGWCLRTVPTTRAATPSSPTSSTTSSGRSLSQNSCTTRPPPRSTPRPQYQG